MRDPRKDLDWRELSPERYEIYEAPAYDFAITRRDLWKALGAGVLLVFTDCAPEAAGGEQLSTRLHLGAGGAVTLMTGKVEIGQGARTELTQVVAEEMHLDPERVRVVMGDTGLVPDDGGTWGSLTTPQTVPIVRRAAAAAYRLLPSLEQDGQLPGTAPSDVPVTDPADWQVCGTSLPKVGARDIVTGAQRYAGDLRPAGMLYGKVKRPPFHRATLVDCHMSEAEKMDGVTVVRDGDFLGVVAPDRRTAEQAIEKIEAQWDGEALVPADKLLAHFRNTAREPVYRPGSRYPALIEAGDVGQGLAEAESRLESSYSLPYIAHVPLEARSALAEWHGDALKVRTGTQVPFGVRREIARAFHLPEENVRVITYDTGGGFGGKHKGECEIEAARLARAAGRPVMLDWSREEESSRSYARPAGLLEVRSGFTTEGKITAWEFHNYNSGAAGLRPPYDIPHLYCGFHRADSPLRQGSYRSLAAVANTFARELHLEEIADRLGMDPVDLRLKNLKDERTRAVLKNAAGRFGWSARKAAPGRGFGVACNLEKGGHLALLVETEVSGGAVRLTRMVAAADFGAAINPDNLRNQIIGALIQGIGGALFEELSYDESGITNARLSSYRVPRFSDVPEIELILSDNRGIPPAGAGEAPITLVAPAIAAAIHDATGDWRRALPLVT